MAESDREKPEAEGVPVIVIPEVKADTVEEAPKDIEPPLEAEPAPEPEREIGPEAPKAEAPAPAPASSRSGFVPMALGGVVAAALGAGAVIYALPKLPEGLKAMLPLTAPAADPAPFKAEIETQNAKIEALTQELAALRAAAPAAPDLSGVQAALDEVSASVRAVREAQEALAGRVAALEQMPLGEGGVAPAALQALQAQLDALRGELAGAAPAGEAAQQAIAAAAAAAEQRISEAEAQAAQMRAETEAAAKKVMAEAAVARLKAAFESGASLAVPLADLTAAGVAAPAELGGEIASVGALQAAFPEAARQALAVARKETAGEGLDKMKAFLMAQLGARSVAPRAGEDADAVLSRAQAAVEGGDFAAALAEIETLPPAAQAPLADWAAQAKARLAAQAALQALGQ